MLGFLTQETQITIDHPLLFSTLFLEDIVMVYLVRVFTRNTAARFAYLLFLSNIVTVTCKQDSSLTSV